MRTRSYQPNDLPSPFVHGIAEYARAFIKIAYADRNAFKDVPLSGYIRNGFMVHGCSVCFSRSTHDQPDTLHVDITYKKAERGLSTSNYGYDNVSKMILEAITELLAESILLA